MGPHDGGSPRAACSERVAPASRRRGRSSRALAPSCLRDEPFCRRLGFARQIRGPPNLGRLARLRTNSSAAAMACARLASFFRLAPRPNRAASTRDAGGLGAGPPRGRRENSGASHRALRAKRNSALTILRRYSKSSNKALDRGAEILGRCRVLSGPVRSGRSLTFGRRMKAGGRCGPMARGLRALEIRRECAPGASRRGGKRKPAAPAG